MDKVYIVFGFFICGLFAWYFQTGQTIFDFDSVKGSKPTGPGQHFHK